MTPALSSSTIWIVDDDLGLLWWLGEIFNEAGCQTVPALSAQQALSLLNTLRTESPGVLVFNPELPGLIKMFQVFRWVQPGVKLIAIVKASDGITTTLQCDAFLHRPLASDIVSRGEWLAKIRKLLREVGMTAVTV